MLCPQYPALRPACRHELQSLSCSHCHCNLALYVIHALQTDIIHRLSGGSQSGRASAAEKALETIKAEGNLVPKPFVPKRRSFAFPNPERMGQRVLEIVGLTHGYGDRQLFDDVSLEMEKRERVALIGERHPALMEPRASVMP